MALLSLVSSWPCPRRRKPKKRVSIASCDSSMDEGSVFVVPAVTAVVVLVTVGLLEVVMEVPAAALGHLWQLILLVALV